MPFALVIHGGAGSNHLDYNEKQIYTKFFKELLLIGYNLLEQGRTSLDVVQFIIEIMEDSGLFNAGRGGIKSIDGITLLDASIMDGETLKIGVVSNVSIIKNPVKMARFIMDHTKHIQLTCHWAEKLAKKYGIETVDPKNYYKSKNPFFCDTVGVVSLDIYGNLAVASSTGGIENKLSGRVSDISNIGAGIYASNDLCAIACTGIGEYFIRSLVAYDIAARIKYKNENIIEASTNSLNEANRLNNSNPIGGVIGLDKRGNICIVHNSQVMLSAYIKSNKTYKINI